MHRDQGLLQVRDPDPVDQAFLGDVLAGLGAAPRAIPARWLYDRAGSEHFERITRLPEYYPTRSECGILEERAGDIAGLVGTGPVVVEFGSGSSTKTPILLGALSPAAYVPVDISHQFLRESCRRLAREFPNLPIFPMPTDFTRPLMLPARLPEARRLGFFPGSTIGNMTVPAAVDLLRSFARTLGTGAALLIGIDRLKPASALVPAYDDSEGVTAAFNLNLLRRINRELDGTIDVDAFAHVALWNAAETRIEMHLRADRDVRFTVAGRPFSMAAGETIHTENSVKYGPREAGILLRAGGWSPVGEWTDSAGLFSVVLAEARDAPAAP